MQVKKHHSGPSLYRAQPGLLPGDTPVALARTALRAAIPQPFSKSSPVGCVIAGVLSILLLVTFPAAASARVLRPGFDKQEYTELLKITAHQLDTPWKPGRIPLPDHYRLAYRSAIAGLDNRWDMWLRDDGEVAMISVRGTTGKNISWLENFYSAMVPATGSIHLSDTFTFAYHLCADARAAVHIGWMIGLGSMAGDIVSRIRYQYAQGVHDFILAGHSQGGAIDYLLTAYLYDLRRTGALPQDIVFKTYCSAAPKPGNLYFAYAYEQLTAGGWAVNVVNPADWVPQTPVTVQTSNDFNTINPFRGARKTIKRLPFPQDVVLGYLYRQLDGGTRKAAHKFEKYLGHLLGRQIRKTLPGYIEPALYPTADYVRTGNTIVLQPDARYSRLFPDTSSNVFIHHLMPAYLYLTGIYQQEGATR